MAVGEKVLKIWNIKNLLKILVFCSYDLLVANGVLGVTYNVLEMVLLFLRLQDAYPCQSKVLIWILRENGNR